MQFCRQRTGRRTYSALAAAVAAVALPSVCRAQSWVGPGGGVFSGNFSTAANWSPATVPGTTNAATFALNQNYTVTFTTNVTNAALIYSNTNGTTSFTFSGTNIRTYTLSSSATFNDGFATFDKLNLNVQGTLLVRTDNVLRFINGADATFSILTIADTGIGSNGTVSVENVNSQLISNNPFSINAIGRAGNSGTLSFSSSAGGSIAGTLVLAADNVAGSKGFFNVLSGATVSVVGVEGGTSGASAQMAALKVQDAGSVLTVGDGGGAGGLIWGASTGPAMTVDVLSGGTLKFNTAGIFTLNPTAVMTVNAATVDTVSTFITVNGALTVTNGAHFSQGTAGLGGVPFNVGNGSTTGAVVHVGGGTSTLLTLARTRIGDTMPALFDQTGGVVTIDNQLQLTNGTYAMAGGSLTTPKIAVSGAGSAIFNHSGGTVAIPGTGSTVINGLSIGQGGTQTATYNLSGASASLSVAGTTLVGEGSLGTFNHSAGSNTSANLVLGSSAAATGNYTLSGKALLSATNVTIGLSGVGNFQQNGGTHTATTLQFAQNSGSTGSYVMTAGALNVQNLNMQGQGLGGFQQQGGSVTVSNVLNMAQFSSSQSSYNIQGGTLSASSAFIESSTSAGGSVFIQFGGAVSFGSMFMEGGGTSYDMEAGSLQVQFDEQIAFGPTTFIQDGGTHTVNGSLIIGDSATYSYQGGTLTASLIQVLRNGTLSLDGTRVSGTSMTVAGTLAIRSGGTLAINTTLLPQSSASLQSSLTLAAPLTLQGAAILDANSGSFAFTPSVIIQSGVTLAGDGSVMTPVNNDGLIEARSGALALRGSQLFNTGTLRNAPGASLFVDATTLTNSGTVTVNAGFMTFKAPLISRSLTIAGGTLGTPLLTNTNGGSIRGFGQITGNVDNFAAIEFIGPTQIVGNFTNRAGATLTVRNDQTLITGQSVNNGTITTLNGKVIFDGGLAPAPLPGAPLAAASSAGGGIDGSGIVSLNGASTLITSYVRQQELALNGTPAAPAMVSVRPKAFGGQASVLNTLTIASSGGTMLGRLDLADTALLVNYTSPASPLVSIRSAIISGNHGGDWTGNGITSSSAAADRATGLGYAEASDVLIFTGGVATFQGQTAHPTTGLGRHTLLGDATLDGVVDFNDLVKLAQNYNTTVSAITDSWWSRGDFTYDGVTDFNDLVKLAQNYNTALPDGPIPGAPVDFQRDLVAAFAAVPEPTALSVVLMGGLLLTHPRRRRRNAGVDSRPVQ